MDDDRIERAQTALERLHEELDRQVAAVERLHAGHLQCRRGCAMCCVDDIAVFEVEAERIRRVHTRLLREDLPHPPGRCAFLDQDGACRVYAERPYVCRTQGLPLRWTEQSEMGAAIELRDICPLNDEPARPIEELDEGACWTIGPFEDALARVQELRGDRRRVRLRDLFDRR